SQFDPRVIRIEPVDINCNLKNISGASLIANPDNNECILMRLDDNIDATKVLSQIVQTTPVRGIQVVKPTLDEVFIEQVARSRGHEAAQKVREEMTNV
ncbi:MAG: DUF4162 domain-containing protein, partial [Phycisphaerales bacterium]|nr:DUF4162 domain-containing protein [Phycisphaerales bacterium]